MSYDDNFVYINRKKPNPRVRLLCFPYAGGGSSSFFHWSDFLHEDIELAIIQPPGRGSRLLESSLDSMEDYVAFTIACLKKVDPIDTYFFGHSMGAKVAYEVCIRLLELGESNLLPKHFFSSACPAPNIPYSGPLRQLMSDEELADYVISSYGEKFLTEAPSLVKMLLPAWRADFTIIETFLRKGLVRLPISCSVVLGESDFIAESNTADWKLCFNTVSKLLIPFGDHFFIEREYRLLLRYLNKTCLAYQPSG